MNSEVYLDEDDRVSIDDITEKANKYIEQENLNVVIKKPTVQYWCKGWHKFWEENDPNKYQPSPRKRIIVRVRLDKEYNRFKYYLSWNDFQTLIHWLDRHEPRQRIDAENEPQKGPMTDHSSDQHQEEGTSIAIYEKLEQELDIARSDINQLQQSNMDLTIDLASRKEILKVVGEERQNERKKNDELLKQIGQLEAKLADLENSKKHTAAPDGVTQTNPSEPEYADTEIIPNNSKETKDRLSLWPWSTGTE